VVQRFDTMAHPSNIHRITQLAASRIAGLENRWGYPALPTRRSVGVWSISVASLAQDGPTAPGSRRRLQITFLFWVQFVPQPGVLGGGGGIFVSRA